MYSYACLPSWLINDMGSTSVIESQLYPYTPGEAEMYKIRASDLPARKVIHEILSKLREFRPDVILMAPWIKRGGSDLETVHFADALVHLGMKCAVFTGTAEDSPWLNRFPEEVMTYEYGKAVESLSEQDKTTILTQCILNAPVKAIHIMNCHVAWRMVASHGLALKRLGVKIFASLYCDDIDDYGRSVGYASAPFPDCCQWIDAITTDNQRFAESVHYRTGYPKEKFVPLYYPTPKIRALDSLVSMTGNSNILWASRITKQKTPQVLTEVIRLTPELTFHVYGDPDSSVPASVMEDLRSLPNCVLYGPYDDFSSLCDASRFGAFLYTSGWDGLPNVLLEALANGLPVIAPNVGGIAELINDDTGYLVSDFTDAAQFRAKLLSATSDMRSAFSKSCMAHQLLQKRHSRESFRESLLTIPDYPFGVCHV